MDATQFFSNYAARKTLFDLPDGGQIELRELSLGQRSKVLDELRKDAIRGQAAVVAESCPLFTAQDIDKLLDMPGQLIADMAAVVLEISGLGDDEKNSESDPSNDLNID